MCKIDVTISVTNYVKINVNITNISICFYMTNISNKPQINSLCNSILPKQFFFFCLHRVKASVYVGSFLAFSMWVVFNFSSQMPFLFL